MNITREEVQQVLSVLQEEADIYSEVPESFQEAISLLQSKLTEMPVIFPGGAFRIEAMEGAVPDAAYEKGYVDSSQSTMEAKVSKFIDAHTKPWVGLTFDDETECLAAGNAHGWKGVMKKTEEKLKEKNG